MNLGEVLRKEGFVLNEVIEVGIGITIAISIGRKHSSCEVTVASDSCRPIRFKNSWNLLFLSSRGVIKCL